MKQKQLLKNSIKNIQICEICMLAAKTANIKYIKVTCVKSQCKIKKTHYHRVCIKCVDKVNAKACRNKNNILKTFFSKIVSN